MSTARRSLHSVTIYNPEKAYNGFTLFAPLPGEPSNVWLIDMRGRFVHRWQWPGWIRMHANLLPTGNILAGLRDPKGPLGEWVMVCADLLEMDWDGNIVWSYKEPYMDGHDRVRMKNGNTLIMKKVQVPKQIAAKVKGGVPGTERDGVMWGDAVQEITPDGKVVWEWLAHEHCDPELDAITPTPGSTRCLWPGINSLVELPNGDIMTCSYNTSNIFIIDKATGDIKWRWGQGITSFPHNPSLLDNGNILLLDNQRFPLNPNTVDCSRVIEVNPRTNEIEWEYTDQNPVNFHTTVQGSCQRLPNGNTLICESTRGRMFEVTSHGETVWEYISPFYSQYGPAGSRGLSNYIFRCLRYGPDYPGLQGKKLDSGKLELWNRLYGSEAFVPRAGQTSKDIVKATSKEGVPIDEELPVITKPHADYGELKPSNAKPGKGDEAASRLKLLGY